MKNMFKIEEDIRKEEEKYLKYFDAVGKYEP